MIPIKILTWNIGVGSNFSGDDTESVFEILSRKNKIFADVIVSVKPDFVCLQEVHSKTNEYSQSAEIADLAGFKYYKEMPLDNAHNFQSDGLKIGVSILSRHSIIETKDHYFKNPHLEEKQENREVWLSHEKGFISIKANISSFENITIISTHLLPFHRFKLGENDPIFISIWKDVDQSLAAYADTNTIICGDFNYNRIDSLLQKLFDINGFIDIEFDHPTHNISYYDHIILPNKFNLFKSKVFSDCNYSDHYPCVAEVELSK